jgi:hypothetical protein
MKYLPPTCKFTRPGNEKLWNVSEFAQRFPLGKVEEDRLRKLPRSVAREIDLLGNAGK